MNFRLASSLLLLATAATSTTATAETTKSKASRYRIFPVRHRPKAGKATVGSTPVSTAVAKTSKALLPPLSVSMSVPSKAAKSKFAKVVKSKAVKCWKDDEQSVSMSLPTRALNVVGRFLDHSVSMSLSVSSKAAKSKVSKCLPEMSLSMSIPIPTMTPTTPFPSYYPTISPTLAPIRRQRMVCQSGDFVDALGNDCFWYEEPNVELGCETLRDDSGDQDLTNAEGKTPWDEVSASYTLHLVSFHCSTRTNTSTIIVFFFVTVLLLRRRSNGSRRSGNSGCFRFLHCHRS